MPKSDPETLFWNNWGRPTLKRLGLDPHRVENGLGHGTPDANYTVGWIENKYVAAWPVRATTPVRIGLEAHQCAWITRRWSSGGAAWVLLGVGKERLLFAGPDVYDIYAGLTRHELLSRAVWYGKVPVRPEGEALLRGILLQGHDALRAALSLSKDRG
jgi:hypothetical protein